MQYRRLSALALASILLGACSSGSNTPAGVTPVTPVLNSNGNPVTGIQTARFDPTNGVIPFPNNLLLSGSTDLTINNPVANPANFGDPAVALSALDGFSTVAPWSTGFSVNVNPATVIPGNTVRMFQVNRSTTGAITGVVRELTAGAEYVAALAGDQRTVVIVPTRPLLERTSYAAVMTTGITDTNGNNATPDTTYFLTQRTAPLATFDTSVTPARCVGSTDQLIPVANACALEPLRQLTNSIEASLAAAGVARSSIVVSWAATTQSTRPVLDAVRSTVTTTPTQVAPSGSTIAVAGLPPIADIFIGFTSLPYYLTAPGTGTPAAPPTSILTSFWSARAGGYQAPFNALGLSPTSTNVTFANPLPVATSTQRVPVLVTVPNAASGRTKPATGWPVILFVHGLTRNRTDALAISATFAQLGYVVVAIDNVAHGVTSGPLYIENTPFGPSVNERTFDVDLVNNTTGAPGADGRIDDSGTHFINLASLLTSRDNVRQSVVDLFQFARNIPTIDLNADGQPDLDGGRISVVAQSLGSIVSTTFMALEPNVNVGVLSVPGGGIAQLLNGSPTFGPRIRAGLAASGVNAGTPAFDQFLLITQTVIDSGDPINYASTLTRTDNVLVHLVVGGGGTPPSLPDQVVPITVAGAPLSGGEPLVANMGLRSITDTTVDAAGVKGVVRFILGDHGSLLSPVANALVTAEMQRQAAIYIDGATGVPASGRAVVVGAPTLIRR
jgi:dienelactone hydrolase